MNLKTWAMNLTICVSLLCGVATFAADDKKSDVTNATSDQTTSVSPDQRKAMAQMHQAMADCLKSNKSLQECQNQMRQNCQHCDGMKWHHQEMIGHGMDWGHCGM